MGCADTDFPLLLKEVRQQLGLSQEELAQRLGISFATVNRWENGQNRPSKLAKARLNTFFSKMAAKGKIARLGGV